MSKRGFESSFKSFKKKLDLELKSAKFSRQAEDQKETVFSIERKFIRHAVLDHKAVLDKKYPGLDYNEVVKSIQLILRRLINKNIGNRNIEWTSPAQTIIVAQNFGVLSNLLTKVRKDIRQEARDLIYNSARKLKNKDKINANVASIVIGGIDVRNIRDGGDINVKKDLKKGLIQTSSRDLNKRNKGQGIELGHAFGPGAAALTEVLLDPRIEDFFSPDIKLQLADSLQVIEKTEGFAKENLRIFNKVDGKHGQLVVTVVESRKSNNIGGTTLSAQKKRIEALTAILEKNKDEVAENWVRAKGSPSIIDLYRNTVIELFLKGKAKEPRRKNTAKFSTSKARKVDVYTAKLATTKIRDKKDKSEELDLQGLIAFLNSKLHDKIQQNMGKGGSRQILNYRTGRFARSAKIQELLPSNAKGSIIAAVKYQKAPYSRFEKGGDLHLPGRDPARIFGRSIRQLLQEQKIANLRRVEVELRG